MKWLTSLLSRWGGEYFALAAARRRALQHADPDACHELAKHAFENKEYEQAGDWIDQALEFDPNSAALWVTRAAVARRLDRFDAAREYLEHALCLDPDQPRALTNLAEIDLVFGRTDAALKKIEAALAHEPDLLPALINRLVTWSELGRHEESRHEGERLLKLHPDNPELLLNIANALIQLGRGRQAVGHLRKSLVLRPNFSEAQYLLASLVGDPASLASCIDYLEKRLALSGESLSLLTSLANAHQAAGNLSRARQLAARILDREPRHVGANLTLASCVSDSGHSKDSDAIYSQLFEQADDLCGMASNWAFIGNYQIDLSPSLLFERHRRWAEKYEPATISSLPARQHGGPLRIGYVSGDFCRHPVGFLLHNIVQCHDKQQVIPIAFSTTLRDDILTRSLKGTFSGWHDVFQDNDDDLLALIHRENIDVLIDLSGHTAFNRLRVFGRRAAPVQVTWLGYFHSTGLRNIDYLITDPDTSPPGCSQYFSETPIHLGSTRFCFSPPPYAPPPSPAPASTGKAFTFGCFNRLAKLNDEVIAVWAEILRQAPEARLWLKSGALSDSWVKNDLIERFYAKGIDAERLVLSPSSGHEEMLAEFSMIDIALDPFPFTGGATSFEGFWQGVPTLTLPGATMVSRQTHAMLKVLDIANNFSAATPRDYIARAVQFARYPSLLVRLRHSLRKRTATSDLCDSESFTRRLERFYVNAHTAAVYGKRLPDYARF